MICAKCNRPSGMKHDTGLGLLHHLIGATCAARRTDRVLDRRDELSVFAHAHNSLRLILGSFKRVCCVKSSTCIPAIPSYIDWTAEREQPLHLCPPLGSTLS